MTLQVSDIPMAAIEVGDDRARSVSDVKVQGLMHVIETLGFLIPISVRKAPKGRFILIDGEHRLEAMRRLGHHTIPAIPSDVSARQARGQEIGANVTAGMTPLQSAIFLAGWQDFYEELHPETRRGVAGGLARQGQQLANLRFADVAAEIWGVSPSQIFKATAAVRRLSKDEKRALDRPAKPLPFDAIMQIGKIADPDERSAVVGMLAEGRAAKVSVARRQYAADRDGAAPIAETPTDKAFKTLLEAWKRAPKTAQRRFVSEAFGDLSPLVVDEAGVRDEAEIAALRDGQKAFE